MTALFDKTALLSGRMTFPPGKASLLLRIVIRLFGRMARLMRPIIRPDGRMTRG